MRDRVRTGEEQRQENVYVYMGNNLTCYNIEMKSPV